MSYEGFKDYIRKISEEFKEVDKKGTIRLISHLDADGISACSILIRALNRENRKYSVSIVPQLDKDTLKEMSKENYSCFIFLDLGSGQLKLIKELFSNKKVFIFDHHEPDSKFKEDENIKHVNPHLFGIDGTKEISGAGVIYLFVRALDVKNEDMAHIAVIGSIGDLQEAGGFSKLNQEILETAEKKGKIRIKRDLKFFGKQTKPLYKLLEYSTDPYIPGVTGSETEAINFLQKIGINPKQEGEWKKISHLTEDESKKLVTAIVMKRLDEENPEDVLGDVYLLQEEEDESPLRDAREFSTLLNACGRLNKASLGVSVCLGDKKAKERAINNLNKYKKEIINAINWFYENKKGSNVVIEDGFVIINAKDNILGTIIGTLASILSKSGEFKEGTLILSLAYTDNRNIKASLRSSGNKIELDLRELIKRITDKVGGESGGHYKAAGAIVPVEKEKEFVAAAKEVLEKICLEEKIL